MSSTPSKPATHPGMLNELLGSCGLDGLSALIGAEMLIDRIACREGER